MCDDVRPWGGDLDWDFALFAPLGIRPAMAGGLNGKETEEKV
jgi:hypothetical protein